MVKHILILPDGTQLSSGADTQNAIQSVTLTQCVNADGELTLGSVCASMLEVRLITPGGGLSLTAGEEVTLYRVEEDNSRHKVGVFLLEKPTRTTANTMQLTGYDRMIKLDRDLTGWLEGLTGWPYDVMTFATMVCGACGLSFAPGRGLNRDFSVEKFSAAQVTGRQLMKWVGEVTGSFCRANADGNIELGWYTPLRTHAIGYKTGQFDEILYDKYGEGLTFLSGDIQSSQDDGQVQLSSDRFTVTDDGQGNVVLTLEDCIETIPYFQRGLDYEDYTVQPVEAVQLRLGTGEGAYRWPEADEQANVYLFSGNPLLQRASDDVLVALETIRERLSKVKYTPCNVSVPATLAVQAGDILSITDKNGKALTVYAMTAKTAGQKLTVECRGSYRRDSAAAVNDLPPQQLAQKAVEAQTQQDIFNKLTQNGLLQGLYMQDGQMYVNASYLMSGIIDAAVVQVVNLIAEKLRSVAGNAELNIDGGMLRFLMDGKETMCMASSAMPIMYLTDYENGSPKNNAEFTPHHLKLGGTSVQPIVEIQTLGGVPKLRLVSGGAKILSWKSNGDGTYTLIGQ